MKGELFINGKDAWEQWGVNMGDGFIDALDAPLQMKEYIENESRLENGKRVLTSNVKIDSRELTLAFTIMGVSESDYRSNKKAFEAELYKGELSIAIPKVTDETYHLIYTGKSVSYGLSLNRCFGSISARFEEPNPSLRD